MISRRKMFGFAAIAPMAAVGISANNSPAVASTKSNDANPDTTIMVLQAQRMKQHRSDNPYTISVTSFENYGPQLGISVGKDGHMWLKINDEWKRVIVE